LLLLVGHDVAAARARSLAVDEEKMFHEEQLLRGKIHMNIKISCTLLIMMQLAMARSSLTEVHL
jgi:hypothetical protein